jgi:hypothetical protein
VSWQIKNITLCDGKASIIIINCIKHVNYITCTSSGSSENLNAATAVSIQIFPCHVLWHSLIWVGGSAVQ